VPPLLVGAPDRKEPDGQRHKEPCCEYLHAASPDFIIHR
jgi:hypothetical protein